MIYTIHYKRWKQWRLLPYQKWCTNYLHYHRQMRLITAPDQASPSKKHKSHDGSAALQTPNPEGNGLPLPVAAVEAGRFDVMS